MQFERIAPTSQMGKTKWRINGASPRKRHSGRCAMSLVGVGGLIPGQYHTAVATASGVLGIFERTAPNRTLPFLPPSIIFISARIFKKKELQQSCERVLLVLLLDKLPYVYRSHWHKGSGSRFEGAAEHNPSLQAEFPNIWMETRFCPIKLYANTRNSLRMRCETEMCVLNRSLCAYIHDLSPYGSRLGSVLFATYAFALTLASQHPPKGFKVLSISEFTSRGCIQQLHATIQACNRLFSSCSQKMGPVPFIFLSAGQLFTFGRNDEGQLGDNTDVNAQNLSFVCVCVWHLLFPLVPRCEKKVLEDVGLACSTRAWSIRPSLCTAAC